MNTQIITISQSCNVPDGIGAMFVFIGIAILAGVLSFHWKLQNEKLRKLVEGAKLDNEQN